MQYIVLIEHQIRMEFDFDSVDKAKKATELLHADNNHVVKELLEDGVLIAVFKNGKWHDEI